LSKAGDTRPRIEKLGPEHDIKSFDCGVEALNRFLQRHALVSQRAGSVQTYLAVAGDAVAGFYSLTVGQVEFDDAPERLGKGLPRHPIPIVLLARLAVDRGSRGQGIGSGLLRDAFRRIKSVSEIAGVRGIAVHAKDEAAKAFYEHFGFVEFPGRPLTLYRLMKDIRLDDL
jgi:GNAT superfamily N-acetyltransferase